MSASVSDSQGEKVVALFDGRRARLSGNCVVPDAAQSGREIGQDIGQKIGQKIGAPENILELSKRFPFHASVEVNDLPWVRAQFSARSHHLVVASVRKILCQEFGRKRVQRTGFQFEIQHRNADILIAALLRVQFYTNQILLPEYNLMGERVEQNGVRITWGVGRSLEQANQDRVRKRKARLPGAF